jgi:hypothetical protein
MKYSFHSLISLLPLSCKCQFRRRGSIQFLCSQTHIPAGWRLENRLNSSYLKFLYNDFTRAKQKTQPFYCWDGVCTAPLHSNGSYSIVACLLVAAGMCLPGRCLAMNVYSDFTISAFGHHITIYFLVNNSNCHFYLLVHN